MIHFFPRFSDDASNSPLARELAASGVEHRLLAKDVTLQYQSRLWLVFVGWPRLLLVATRAGWTSLVTSRPRPDTVVLNNDIEVLVFGVLRAILSMGRDRRARRTPRIVLVGFIYTDRRNLLLRALRQRYFRVVMAFADLVLCHSQLEIDALRARFAGSHARFTWLPYGLYVGGRESVSSVPRDPPYLFAAGRSGRDYRTLIDAVRDTPFALRIACDRSEALAHIEIPANVTVLRACYGADYIGELAGASAVVVPLAVDDISAGQMVMLQAMAFGKPVVVTRTPTIAEYASDGHEVVMVPRGDASALRASIDALMRSPERLAAIGDAGRERYERSFTMRAYVRNVLDAVSSPRDRATG